MSHKITAASTKAADQPVAPSTRAGHGKPSSPAGRKGIYSGMAMSSGYNGEYVKADKTRRNVGK